MTKSRKLLARLLTIPRDFTWDELTTCLAGLGLREIASKRGSYRTFAAKSGMKVFVHKLHPGNVVKPYALRQVVDVLHQNGLVDSNGG